MSVPTDHAMKFKPILCCSINKLTIFCVSNLLTYTVTAASRLRVILPMWIQIRA